MLASLAACPSCPENLAARAAAFGPSFLPLLLAASLPFLVLAVVASNLWRRRPVTTAGLVLGVGLGGFLDGIVLHQILQWHGMLTSVLPPSDLVATKTSMVGDGLFHALTWTTTAAGVALLHRAGRRGTARGRTLVAGMLAGWGGFNLLEGVLDHHVLGIHHVHPGAGQLAWDLAYLATGPLLVGAGALVAPSLRASRVIPSAPHGRRADDPPRAIRT